MSVAIPLGLILGLPFVASLAVLALRRYGRTTAVGIMTGTALAGTLLALALYPALGEGGVLHQ
ncbi:MAG: hypothetical protein ABI300_11185, partial [Rhodanobacter sp.]